MAHRTPSKDSKTNGSERPGLVMVSVGILLFVAGFLVTLAAMDDGRATAANNGDLPETISSGSNVTEEVYLMVGILVSLAGVVLATVGPAAGILKGNS